MAIAYSATTMACTFLMDADGVCRRVLMKRERRTDATLGGRTRSQAAKRCIGAQYVAHAAPDGYTLLVASNGPMTINPFVQAHLGYDPLKDFAAVALTSYVPHVLIVSNNLQAKSVADFIALSKRAPITIATSEPTGVDSSTTPSAASLSPR